MIYTSKVLHLPKLWQMAPEGQISTDLLPSASAQAVNQTMLTQFLTSNAARATSLHPSNSSSSSHSNFFGVEHEVLEPRKLYWFRWIIGHQTSFLLWALSLLQIKQYQAGKCSMASLEKNLSGLLGLYSGILVYTASTSLDVYQQIIRPFMMTYHPAFSGSWAADYGLLKACLRHPEIKDGGTGKITRAYMAANQIHGKIGKRLVGNSPSLNKLAKQARIDQTKTPPSEVHIPDADLAFVFDAFFLVQRSPVGHADLINQLVTRLAAILDDFHQHGFQIERPGESPAFLERQHNVWDHLPRHALDCVTALVHAMPEQAG